MLALLLLGMEMATGTFYMLVLSLATALGGVVALAGMDTVIQLSLAGLAAVIGTVALRKVKGAQPQETANASLDIGQPVQVISWNADGTARVRFRGADWDAETESDSTPRDVTLYIKATRGSTLILTQHKP